MSSRRGTRQTNDLAMLIAILGGIAIFVYLASPGGGAAEEEPVEVPIEDAAEY